MSAGKGARKVRRLRRKHTNLMLELQHLYSELNFCEEELEFASGHFQEELVAYCEENNLDLFAGASPAPQPAKTSETLEIITEPIKFPNNDIKKLFKKIAMVCHPDRLVGAKEEEKEEKTKLFVKAQLEARQGNYYQLSMIALKLGIELSPPKEAYLKMLKEESNTIKRKIGEISGTYAWAWCEEETEEGKGLLIKKYVELMGTIAAKSKTNDEED